MFYYFWDDYYQNNIFCYSGNREHVQLYAFIILTIYILLNLNVEIPIICNHIVCRSIQNFAISYLSGPVIQTLLFRYPGYLCSTAQSAHGHHHSHQVDNKLTYLLQKIQYICPTSIAPIKNVPIGENIFPDTLAKITPMICT